MRDARKRRLEHHRAKIVIDHPHEQVAHESAIPHREDLPNFTGIVVDTIYATRDAGQPRFRQYLADANDAVVL